MRSCWAGGDGGGGGSPRARGRGAMWRAFVMIACVVLGPAGARAMRKCCAEGDEVLVAWTATGEMQCVRGDRLSATVWARVEERAGEVPAPAPAPAGPPPACVGAPAVTVWVLGAAAGDPAAETDPAQTPLEQPPALWWRDELRFCVEAVQLGDRRNNLTARVVAVGCPGARKGGSEGGGGGGDGAEGHDGDATGASGGGSGSGSGLGSGATEVLLGAAAPPPEPLWTGGELVWVDVVNGVPEPESPAPWSPPPLYSSPAPPPQPQEGKGGVVRVAVGAGGAGVLRKCCPRGFALSMQERTCVALQTQAAASAPTFPAPHTLVIKRSKAGPSGGLLALLVGPAEAVHQGEGPLSLTCPPGMARTFHVVQHVEVEGVEILPDTANSTTAGSVQEADAAQSCVEAQAGGGAKVVVARCTPRSVACGEGAGGWAAGDGEAACVTKCCPLGHSFVGKRCVRSDAVLRLDFKSSFTEAAAPASLAFIEKRPLCEQGFYPLEPSKFSDDNWHLQRDGRVFRPVYSKLYTLDGYCLEHANTSLSTGLVVGVHAFICMQMHPMGETVAV